MTLFFKKNIYLFIYLFMAVLGLRFVRGPSLIVASGDHSSSQCAGLPLSWPLLLPSTGSKRAGSVIVAHGPAAPRHVGSSQTRARTRVPCIGRQTPNHCATREALVFFFDWAQLLSSLSFMDLRTSEVTITAKPMDPFLGKQL